MERRMNRANRLPWEAALFLALYPVLPDYFALELSGSLPMVTACRVLIVLLGVMLLVRQGKDLLNFRKNGLKALNLQLTESPMLRFGFLGYFLILLVVNATFLTETSESVKQLFVMVAEEYAVVWMLCLILNSRARIESAVKILVITSGVMAVFASLSCILDRNVFYVLNTVSRDMLMSDYYRLGMLRAAAGFGHPVYYGAYCAVIFPLAMYLVENTQNKRERLVYSLCLALDFVGLILSNSRGSMLALGCLGLLVFGLHLLGKKLKALFKTYLPIGALALVILVLVASFSPLGIQFLSRTAGSVMDSIQSLFPVATEPPTTDPTDPDTTDPTDPTDPDTTEPTEPTEPPIEYGENQDGVGSRLDQFSGITWTVVQEPLFGFGPNCHVHGQMAYMYYPGVWSHVRTFDVNVVYIIGQWGLLGLAGYLLLYGSMGFTVIGKRFRADPLAHHIFLAFVCYMLCLVSISTLDHWFWVFAAMLISMVAVLRREPSKG